MKTISDFSDLIKNDEELKKIITESSHIHNDYKPRNKHRRGTNHVRTPASIAFEHFWTSFDGAQFRCLLESKYSIELSDNQIRGRLKDAITLFIVEVLSE